MLNGIFWKPYSRLYIIGDNSGWSVDDDARDLKRFASELGISAKIVSRTPRSFRQAVHYTSQFSLYQNIYKKNHRISVDYYHGRPETQESFRKCFEALKIHHQEISRVRVSNREMEVLIKSSGIDPEKVMRIPIGIDLDIFKPSSRDSRSTIRNSLGIPQDAVVIGSFQKDGTGWGEGNEPKLIKGPDIFLKVLENLKKDVPNLWVLLSGPARGFVKHGLEKLDIPYCHQYLENSTGISTLYDATDLYLITSREEGGPKACLQSMAKGVPLVTTAVGQCKDLAINGVNALVARIDDVEDLSRLALEGIHDRSLREKLVSNGFKRAKENSFASQLPLWKEYFRPLMGQ